MINGQISFEDKNITRDSLLRIYPLCRRRAEAERTQEELEARAKGRLPLAEPGGMFPEEVMFGTAWYPASLFGDSLRKGLAEVFPCDEKGRYRLPMYMDLHSTSGIFVEYDGAGLHACQSFTHNIMWSFLSEIPVSKLNISVFDCERKGGSITPFLDFRKNFPEIFDGKMYTDREAVSARLKEYSDRIDERIQLRLGASFGSIIEYNRQNPLKAETIHLIVINDFPSGFGADSADRLLNILKNGGRCGIYTIVNHNRDIQYSEYEKLDSHIEAIKACSDVFEIEDGKCFCRNLDGPIESDIHISGPEAADFAGRYLKAKGSKASDNSLSRRCILGGDLFRQDSTDLLEIPVGIGSGGERVQLGLGGEGSSHHALIAGGTGGGKSSLLHTIILSAMLHYRPDELNLYLMDFKNGTEFEVYEKYRLPHIKLLALDARQEFGESILEKLAAEMLARSDSFTEVGVSNLGAYRKATGESMPRILVIIDEFQILFNESENREAARKCAELTKNLVNQGRSYGIHLIMATQSTAGIPELSLSGSAIDQMMIRIGLRCPENDARYLFRDNADKALGRMKGPVGTAVMTSDYTEKDNFGFRVAFCDNDFRNNCLKIIEGEFRSCEYSMQTFKGGRVKKLFERYAESRDGDESGAHIAVDVGEPIKVAPPLKITFDKKRKHNVLICGTDEGMADNIFNEFMLGVLKSGKADVYCVDGDILVDEETFQPFYEQYQRIGGRFRLAQDNNDITAYLNEVYEQFKQRKKRKSDRVIFIAIRNLQYIELCQRLLKGETFDVSEYTDGEGGAQENVSDDPFDFLGGSPKNEEGLTDKFFRLVDKGSMFGIHFIVSCTDYRVVHENMLYGSNILAKFTERFVFNLNDSDGGHLIEGVSVVSLSDNTVYYSDGIKPACRIRPYLFPEAGELGAYIEGGMDDGKLPRRDGGARCGRTDDTDNRPAAEKLNALYGDGGSTLPGGRSAEEERRRWIERMEDLGDMYYHGLGVKQNYSAAFGWFSKAADEGNSAAMYNLGCMYYNGMGVAEEDRRTAIEWYKKAAEKGNSDAMYELGRIYYYGEGVGGISNYRAATAWYEKAAEKGHRDAMYELALMYYTGLGGKCDHRAAMAWYEKAAVKGDTDAMKALGKMYEKGEGIEKPDYRKALIWYERAAEKGENSVLFTLGSMYRDGRGVEKPDCRTAMVWYERAAEKQSSISVYAMNTLGDMYRQSEGIERPDYRAAMAWYEKAAKKGDTDAMNTLGDMYRQGEGMERPDYRTAMAWYKKAAEKYNVSAMNILGDMYRQGEGMERPNYLAAMVWYEKAAEHDNASAMNTLGDMYYDEEYAGIGEIEQNYRTAMAWYKKAAERGNIPAMLTLGYMYRKGDGTELNYKEAVKWYKKAAGCGDACAIENLDSMYKSGQITRQDYDEALQLYSRVTRSKK